MWSKLSELFKKLNGNTFKAVAVFLIVAFLFWLYGCQGTVTSLENESRKVTRSELQAEITSFNAKAKAKIENLDKQDEIRSELLDALAVQTTSGTFNPIGLINTLISIGAVGYAADAKKKLSSASKKTTTTS